MDRETDLTIQDAPIPEPDKKSEDIGLRPRHGRCRILDQRRRKYGDGETCIPGLQTWNLKTSGSDSEIESRITDGGTRLNYIE